MFDNLFFVSLTCESSDRCVITMGSFWGVPSQILLQTYLSLGGGGGVECDGHAHGSSAGLVDWAIVCLIIIS